MIGISAEREGRAPGGSTLVDQPSPVHGSNVAQAAVRDGPAAPGTEAFTVFAAMPFDPSFEDVFHVAIGPAVASLGGTAVRVDLLMHGGDAVLATQRAIRGCRALVADVSTGEPDVLYELGMAHALGRPTVQVCCTSYDDMPFMVRNRETLPYQAGRTHLLRHRLAVYLESVLASG